MRRLGATDCEFRPEPSCRQRRPPTRPHAARSRPRSGRGSTGAAAAAALSFAVRPASGKDGWRAEQADKKQLVAADKKRAEADKKKAEKAEAATKKADEEKKKKEEEEAAAIKQAKNKKKKKHRGSSDDESDSGSSDASTTSGIWSCKRLRQTYRRFWGVDRNLERKFFFCIQQHGSLPLRGGLMTL